MSGQRGVQPVVGVVILVAIVILLSATVLFITNNFDTPREAPQASTEPVFYSEFNTGTGEATPYITLRHQGGETIQRENIRAVVRVGGKTYEDVPLEGPDSGSVTATEKLTYDLSSTNLCGRDASSFTVDLIHEPSQKLVAQQEVAIRSKTEVNVSDNTVSANVPFTATVSVVGMAASSKSGTNLEPDTLNARIVINRQSGTEYLTPWPDGDTGDAVQAPFEDNINRPIRSPPIRYTTGRLSANTTVSLEMRSDKPNSWDYSGAPTVTRDGTTYAIGDPVASAGRQDNRFWVNSSNSSEGNLVLLQDGDTVPAYGLAGSHQRSLKDILGPRLQDRDTLKLDDNDVAILYELTGPDAQPENADSSGNPDYNDAVAIIEIDPVPGSARSEPGVLYC